MSSTPIIGPSVLKDSYGCVDSFDVYITRNDKIKLLDFNAVCTTSSPLLFAWEDLGMDPQNPPLEDTGVMTPASSVASKADDGRRSRRGSGSLCPGRRFVHDGVDICRLDAVRHGRVFFSRRPREDAKRRPSPKLTFMDKRAVGYIPLDTSSIEGHTCSQE